MQRCSQCILQPQLIGPAKGEGADDYSTVTRSFKKFCLVCKNFSNQTRQGKSKIMDSKAVLQTIEVNPTSSTWRVSGKLDISPFSVICHLHNLNTSIRSSQIMPDTTKILQNFWLTHVTRLFLEVWWQMHSKSTPMNFRTSKSETLVIWSLLVITDTSLRDTQLYYNLIPLFVNLPRPYWFYK